MQSSLNQLVVFDESDLSIVDLIKTSHPTQILCMDVAQVSKDIVSYSSLVLDSKGELEKHLSFGPQTRIRVRMCDFPKLEKLERLSATWCCMSVLLCRSVELDGDVCAIPVG